MTSARALLQRLLPLACAACSPRTGDVPAAPAPSAPTSTTPASTASSPSPPKATTTSTTPPAASSTAPVASASSAPSDDRGPSATEVVCAAGASCVPGSFCATLDVGKPRGFFGVPSTVLGCSDAGVFERDRRITGSGTVCIAKRDACAPADAPKTAAALKERFRVDQCPVFLPGAQKPRERKNGAGKIECCYEGGFGFCEGRPLLVGGRPRVASLGPDRGSWT